ncbi:MAG: hypothetical protein ACTS4U_00280 [Candidatus Hodgkinia cicadicola]
MSVVSFSLSTPSLPRKPLSLPHTTVRGKGERERGIEEEKKRGGKCAPSLVDVLT